MSAHPYLFQDEDLEKLAAVTANSLNFFIPLFGIGSEGGVIRYSRGSHKHNFDPELRNASRSHENNRRFHQEYFQAQDLVDVPSPSHVNPVR